MGAADKAPKTNPELKVLCESLELEQRGSPQWGSILSLLDPDSPPGTLPDFHPCLEWGGLPTPGSVLEPGLAVNPRAWMMSTSS